jgi:hypothetical protein
MDVIEDGTVAGRGRLGKSRDCKESDDGRKALYNRVVLPLHERYVTVTPCAGFR